MTRNGRIPGCTYARRCLSIAIIPRLVLLLCILFQVLAAATTTAKIDDDNEKDDEDAVPSRIVFGSCNSQFFDQPFWEVLPGRHPTAFIWGGDAVYGDDRPSSTGPLHQREGTPDYMRHLYDTLLQNPGYQSLLATTHVFGTMDDHDFGIDNGDSTLQWKRENGLEFVRFLGLEEATSVVARRAARGKGVYGVQVYDFSRADPSQRLLSDEEAGLDPDVVPTSGSEEEPDADSINRQRQQLVAVFVLDIRTNKTPWPDRMFWKDPEGDFLGDEQWKWFETALGRSRASVNIVVSGLQVHAPWFGSGKLVENWSGFPKSQHRLYQALLRPNVRAPLLISGDVHMAQIMKRDCRRHASADEKKYLTRPIYEVTTSGMTHSWGSPDSGVCGIPSKSWLCYFYPFNVWMGIVANLAHHLIPLTSVLRDAKTNALQYSLARNVAEIEFDWVKRDLSLRILGDDGTTLLRQDWSMDLLSGTENSTSTTTGRTTMESAERNSRLDVNLDDFFCLDYQIEPSAVHFTLATITTVVILLVGFLYPLILFIGLAYFLFTRRRTAKRKRE